MTFHGRLRLFFGIIVFVPMLAIAAVLFSLTADSERGKADAGIATGLSVAISLYGEGRAAAEGDLRRVARDKALKRALFADDPAATDARLEEIVRAQPRIVAATLSGPMGQPLARAGSSRGVAARAAPLVEAKSGGARLGTLAVSVMDAPKLALSAAKSTSASQDTRLDFVVLRGGKAVATTAPGVRTIPRAGNFDSGGREYRGRRQSVGRWGGAQEQIGAFKEAGGVNSAITASRLLIACILIAFLLLALATSVFVVRALQGQVGQFLEAARRLAGGRFDQPVPIVGSDEFAQLGLEFNNMSEQLAANIREVERKRRELEEMIRQTGKAMTMGLDRQGIYDLLVQTAVRACEAESGRAIPLDLRVLRGTRAGTADPALLAGLEAAERAVFAIGPDTGRELTHQLRTGGRRTTRLSPTSAQRDGVHALALPLQARLGTRAGSAQVGAVSIARRERPFTPREADLLEYLAGQAEVSIENAQLHETVQEQAITDELTRLSNRRQMDRALDRELDRRRRFRTPMGLVVLDIDEFKKVNDTFGHQQGDEVIAAVAGVLRDLTRDIDEAARYGGEEFAVVLPQTDLAGAALLADRMREATERLRVPHLGGGEPLHVTASFGVAAVPASAEGKESLLKAADDALYRAKRAGKNKVECAPDL